MSSTTIYPNSETGVVLSDTGKKAIVGTLVIVVFLLMGFELAPPDIAFFVALVIVMLTQILTMEQTLAGFSNEGMVTVAVLFLVVKGVEKSNVVDYFVRKSFGITGSRAMGTIRMYGSMFCLSTFFNNTPLVALMIPPVRDWGRVVSVPPSQLLMPLSFAVLLGSMNSMIGTSTNLIVQGLMQADRGYSFPFFAPIGIAAPVGVTCLVYMIFAAPYVLPKNKSGLLRMARDNADELVAEVEVQSTSSYIGKSLVASLGDLGIPSSTVVKIRRRAVPRPTNIESAENTLNVGDNDTTLPDSRFQIADQRYLQAALTSWGGSSAEEELYSVQSAIPQYIDIVTPDVTQPILIGDIIFLSCAKEIATKLVSSMTFQRRGLRILSSSVYDLAGFGSELVEAVLSRSNPLVGKMLGEALPELKARYGMGVLAFRSRNLDVSAATAERDMRVASARERSLSGRETLTTAEEEMDIEMLDTGASMSSSEGAAAAASEGRTLLAGDLILAIVKEDQVEALSKDLKSFYVVTKVGSMPKPMTYWGMIPVVLFVILLIVVATETITMCPAAMILAAVLFMGGWVTGPDIVQAVDFRLIILIATSLSFATSISTSGLAADIAQLLNDTNSGPTVALLLIYVVTLFLTEVVSNNAAAALMYPIAVAYADKLQVSFKPFAMIVMFSSSMAFACPIGYQTHLMVWQPGGYKFIDFIKFGLPIDIIYMVGAVLLTPQIWKF